MSVRDNKKDSVYFLRFVEVADASVAKFENALVNETVTDRRWMMLSRIASRSEQKAIAQYSLGLPMAEIRASVIDYLDSFHAFAEELGKDPERAARDYPPSISDYYRLAAWLYLFEIDKPLVDRAAVDMFYYSSMKTAPDGSIKADPIEAFIMQATGAGFSPIDNLVWPEAYQPLLDCIRLSPAYREDNLKRFMDNWYRECGKRAQFDIYWYDNHKSKHDTYFGYWCFEAAAVAKMLHINDEHLKDHPHYPYDARHG